MRVLPIAAIAAAGIVLPAVAQNSAQTTGPSGPNVTGQQYNRSNGQPDASCGNRAAWTGQMSQRLAQNGYTNAQQMPQAFVIHAVGPDGVPVVMLIAPVQGQQ